MKRVLSLLLAAGLALSLCVCGDVLVDLDTPKSGELSAQYDFYPDSMNTIRADMQIRPEQADDVFIALVSCGLDGKTSTLSADDWKDVIRQCAAAGCRHIQFIGGELSICSFLPELIRFARSAGIKAVTLFSNLFFMND